MTLVTRRRIIQTAVAAAVTGALYDPWENNTYMLVGDGTQDLVIKHTVLTAALASGHPVYIDGWRSVRIEGAVYGA